MLKLVEMPIDRLSDHELSVRKWEAVMSSGYGCTEYQRLERESVRRMSGRDDLRATSKPH